MHKINYQEFFNKLKGRIKGKVVILGIGNELRGDDGFGVYLAESLKGKIDAAVFNCGTALENYYNPIVKENPDVIIIFDIAKFRVPYSEIGIFEKEDILELGLSTHNISPKVFIEILEHSIKADIMMIGVRPKSNTFGESLSAEVKETADILKDFFIKILPKKVS